MRQTRQVTKAKLVTDGDKLRLFGVLASDPSGRLTVGHRIVTSPIIGISGRTIKTENNDYEVVYPSFDVTYVNPDYADSLFVGKEVR